MTENTNESSSKLLRLEMIFVFHTEEEMEEEEDVTPIEELPRWTVRESQGGFQIREGLAVLKSTLARRFSDPLRNYIKNEVAVELPTMPEEPFEGVFED
jgi:hypothetical protein